jgi:ribokinase
MTARIPKIVVVGPSYIDTAIKCAQFPRPSQTVEGAAFSCSPTGAGPNRAVEAAFCGCEVYLISKVGDDTFGQLAKDSLTSHGVNTDFVYTAQAMHTGAVVTIVDSLGENMSCISPGANRALGTDELACAAAEQLIGSADLCLIHADLPYEAVATVIRLSSIYKTKIILEAKLPVNDLNGIGNIDLPKEFYSVNILVPDLGDRYAVADVGAGDVHKLKRIGSELVARGMESVVMKMGVRGSFISDGEGTAHIPGFEVEMVDHTGCSDAFAGALAAACGSGDRLEKAVRFASAAGALACSKFGAQDALPSKEQILTFLLDDPD